jgi:hypothetical protein
MMTIFYANDYTWACTKYTVLFSIHQDPFPPKFESPNVQNQIFTLHLTNKCHQKEQKTRPWVISKVFDKIFTTWKFVNYVIWPILPNSKFMIHEDENMVKGAKGAKLKVLFQGLHMICVIFVLVYNLKFYILNTPFNITFFRYKYILTRNWFYIIYIIHSCPLSHKYDQILLKAHFQNS